MRMEMNEEESKRYAVLIVVNHSSRLNSYAIEYLIMHRIHILTLTAHCTHVLQPIDISRNDLKLEATDISIYSIL